MRLSYCGEVFYTSLCERDNTFDAKKKYTVTVNTVMNIWIP